MQDISEDILRKASDGDLKSFEAIYRGAGDFVHNVALRIVNNREDAEEVTQEVFINIYHNLKSFRFESSFKTWIYRITANHAINYAKKLSRVRNKTVEYDDQSVAGSVPGDIPGKIEQEFHSETVQELLGAINPEQRACVVLRNIEGLSYQEIAQALKININTVRSRLKRAREKLMSFRKQVEYGRM